MSKVSIIGAYNTQFGAFIKRDKETKEITDLKSFYDLFIEAGRGAIEDAGLDAKDIDAVYVGSCSPSMFVNQEHVAPLGTLIDPALRLKPMTRTECACASSSVAMYDAAYMIEAGRAKNVLVIGVEKMNLLDTRGVTHALACSSYYPEEGANGMTFPGLFAELAKEYTKHYDIGSEEFQKMLASVSALCYSNGIENPLAHFGPGGLTEKLGITTPEAILAMPEEGRGANMMIADPLRLHDCSLVSDGAAALVLSASDSVSADAKAVEIAGIGQAAEYLPLSKREKKWTLEAGKTAVAKSYEEAGVTADDVDFAEVHDCFTINQLLTTEALGLSEDGKAGFDYMEGRFSKDDDKVSVNLSGGLKAKGHPVGATGASMHALSYKQLIGEPIGATTTKGQPEVGVVFNVGGSAVTNCVTVMKRTK